MHKPGFDRVDSVHHGVCEPKSIYTTILIAPMCRRDVSPLEGGEDRKGFMISIDVGVD